VPSVATMRFRLSPRAIALAASLVVALQLASPSVAQAATGSTLTLTAKPSSATVGAKITLSGTLAFADMSPAENMTISLTRDDAAGTGQPVGDVATEPDGSYSATDTVHVGGTVTYHASFAGTTDYDPASASDTVSVAKLPTHVSLHTSADAVRYGTPVHLTAHLGRGTESRVVAVYAKPDGGSEKLVRKAKVDRHRDLRATFAPSKDTTFIARYDGDASHRSAHANAVTRVRVIVRAKLAKAVARSGRYHIYRRGAHAPCIVRVLPNHKGFAVRATLQVFTKGSWRKSAARSFRLNASSVVGFAVRGSPNVNFRVHVSLPTHHDHLGDTSPWQYLRFR
jgi:hypothetical protein